MVDKLFSDHFVKKPNCTYLWTNSLKFYTVCFYYWYYQNILKLSYCLLLHTKFFQKTKRGLELASLPRFLHDFWRKMFLLLYSIKGTLRLHMKIICWRFHIKTPFTFWDMRTWGVWKVCLQTFINKKLC